MALPPRAGTSLETLATVSGIPWEIGDAKLFNSTSKRILLSIEVFGSHTVWCTERRQAVTATNNKYVRDLVMTMHEHHEWFVFLEMHGP